MCDAILNFSDEGHGDPLLILHGLFGSSLNWKSLARELAQRFRVIRVDLRNHGESFHDSRMDYSVMAQDVMAVMTHLGLESARVLGHSMGGKVAMKLVHRYPACVQQLIVADIAPVAYRHEYDGILAALSALDLSSISRRAEADRILGEAITNRAMRQFLLQNLVINGGARWKINLPVLTDSIDQITGFEDITDWHIETNSLFVRGGLSDYISERHWSTVQAHFSDVRLVTLEHAGHWLHAEQPDVFLHAVEDFLCSP